MGFHIKKFADQTGLMVDKKDSLLYGMIAGYPVTAQYIPRRSMLICRVTGKDPDSRPMSEIQQALDNFRMSRTGISQIGYQNRELSAVTAIPALKSDERAAETLRAVVELAASLGLVPCCEGCGAETGWDFYSLDGNGVVICDACQSYTEQNMADVREQKAQEQANIGGLALGMLCGSAVLFGLTYLLLRMGYVAYITGYVGMLVSFVAMKKWGGKLTIPAVTIALILGLAIAVFTPILDISQDIAKFNTENYTSYAQYNQSYSEIMAKTADMTAEEKAEAEQVLETSFKELEERHQQYTQAMKWTTTGAVLSDFGAVWKHPLYSEVHVSVIKCIIWGLASIIIGSAVTLPAMLRESKGIHKLRRLGL